MLFNKQNSSKAWNYHTDFDGPHSELIETIYAKLRIILLHNHHLNPLILDQTLLDLTVFDL